MGVSIPSPLSPFSLPLSIQIHTGVFLLSWLWMDVECEWTMTMNRVWLMISRFPKKCQRCSKTSGEKKNDEPNFDNPLSSGNLCFFFSLLPWKGGRKWPWLTFIWIENIAILVINLGFWRMGIVRKFGVFAESLAVCATRIFVMSWVLLLQSSTQKKKPQHKTFFIPFLPTHSRALHLTKPRIPIRNSFGTRTRNLAQIPQSHASSCANLHFTTWYLPKKWNVK